MSHDGSGNFQPDAEMGMFFRVNTFLLIAGASEKSPSQVALEMQFNKNWGLMYIQLFGEVTMAPSIESIPGASELMAGYTKIASASKDIQDDIKKALGGGTLNLETSDFTSRFPANLTAAKAEVKINLILNMDFNRSIFTGKASAYVNALDLIVGNQSTNGDNYAGSVYMVFKQNEWFIHAGYQYYGLKNNLPDVGGATVRKFEPLGLSLKMGDITVGDISGYFLLGHHIPELPNPKTDLGITHFPDEGLAKMNSLKRGGESNFDGQGLGFGVAAQFQVPDMKVLFITARLYAYLGFDVLLKHYNSCPCSEWPDKNRFGIKGWWAQGQAYAGFDALIGLDVDVWIYKGHIDLAEAKMAILFQAKLPNPTWFSGTLYGSYSVLGGIVHGDFDFDVTLGDKCGSINPTQPNVNPPEVVIVKGTYPENNEELMSMLAKPNVTYNYAFNKPFGSDNNSTGEGQYKFECEAIRGKYINKAENTNLKSSTIQNKETMQKSSLNGDEGLKLVPKWSDNKKMYIEFADGESWAENSDVEIEVDIVFKEKIGSDWVIVSNTVDGVVEESRNTIKLNFKTGTQPSKLEYNNIVEMYPAIDQDYFYTGESFNGFIHINPNQDYLLKDVPYIQLSFDSEGETTKYVVAAYSSSSQKLTYTIPALLKDKTYTVHVKKGDNEEGAVDILTFSFHTSKYSTLADKFETLKSVLSRPQSPETTIPFSYEYGEPFGREEILGNEYMNNNKPLITAEIDVNQNNNYFDKMAKYVYVTIPDIQTCGYSSIPGIYHAENEIKATYVYSTDWEVMKKEMELESTFPFVVVSFDEMLGDVTNISSQLPSICSQGLSSCADLESIVNDYHTSGSCEFNLPIPSVEYKIPLKLSYDLPSAAINHTKNLAITYNY